MDPLEETLRLQMEDQLGALAHIITCFRWPLLIPVLLATGYLTTWIPLMEVKWPQGPVVVERLAPIDALVARFRDEGVKLSHASFVVDIMPRC
jgi:hypothetical protein